jgi:hypothetical protein
MDLCYNRCVFVPLRHKLHTKMNTNALKNYTYSVSLFKLSINYSFILNDVFYGINR